MSASFLFTNDPTLLENYRIYIDERGDLQKDAEHTNTGCTGMWRTFRWFKGESGVNTDCLRDIINKIKFISSHELADESLPELKCFLKNLKRFNRKVETHNERCAQSFFTASYDCPGLNAEIRKLKTKIEELERPIDIPQVSSDDDSKKDLPPPSPQPPPKPVRQASQSILERQRSIQFNPAMLTPGGRAPKPKEKVVESEVKVEEKTPGDYNSVIRSKPLGPRGRRPPNRSRTVKN